MKRKLFSKAIILIFLLSFLIVGCSQETVEYNLIIANSSGDSFKSIGFSSENSSGDVIPADNSQIEFEQIVTLNMERNEFNLHAIDTEDNEFMSQKFDLDFETNKDAVYTISIEKDLTGDLAFILME